MTSKKENILDQLEPFLKQRFESEMSPIYNKLKDDGNIGEAIESIFENTNDLNVIQAKLLLLIRKHLKNNKLNEDKSQEEDEQKIAEDISKFCNHLLENIYKGNITKLDGKNGAIMLDAESKKNLKKTLKHFAIYEVYKIMNPKRIAGETKKDNYTHNLLQGGEKLASKYEGGKESDLKSYGQNEVTKLKKQVARFKKGGGLGRS